MEALTQAARDKNPEKRLFTDNCSFFTRKPGDSRSHLVLRKSHKNLRTSLYPACGRYANTYLELPAARS